MANFNVMQKLTGPSHLPLLLQNWLQLVDRPPVRRHYPAACSRSTLNGVMAIAAPTTPCPPLPPLVRTNPESRTRRP
jgi:hypothetical protein